MSVFLNLRRGMKKLWSDYHFFVPPKMWKKYMRSFCRIIINGRLNPFLDPVRDDDFSVWVNNCEEAKKYTKLKYRPLISVLIPTYNVKGKYLKECIESILKQKYDNYEICLVDDASTNKSTIDTLKKYEGNEKVRIKFRKKNGHISRATNDALEMARGEFVALMDDDDILAENALYEVVKVLNNNKKIDFIYSDEDKINIKGERCLPHFKPDWSPDTLLSSNYISHLGVLRKTIVQKIGGFRVGYEGSQDYDLYLRFTEKTSRIYHIPKILYHWRMIPGSTAVEIGNKNYALERGRKALQDALRRRNIAGKVKIADNCPYYYIEYDIIDQPKVSIIIPTRNFAKMTRKCLESVYEKTIYENYEVVIVDNGSTERETLELFEEYKSKHDNFRVMRVDIDFNYAKLNNMAIKDIKSDYIVLLNNDIEVITPNWLELMLGYASQSHIGAVGVKLLYGDDTVQHAGVIMGLGVASHAFVGKERNEVVWGGRLSVPYDYSAVTAACLMVDRKKWDKVGGMEEKLKVAYNDVDFCLKLRKVGYYNVCIPMVEMYHYESRSRGQDITAEKKARFDAEQDFMREKWHNVIDGDPFYNSNYSRKMQFKLDRKA